MLKEPSTQDVDVLQSTATSSIILLEHKKQILFGNIEERMEFLVLSQVQAGPHPKGRWAAFFPLDNTAPLSTLEISQ